MIIEQNFERNLMFWLQKINKQTIQIIISYELNLKGKF